MNNKTQKCGQDKGLKKHCCCVRPLMKDQRAHATAVIDLEELLVRNV